MHDLLLALAGLAGTVFIAVAGACSFILFMTWLDKREK